MNNTQFVIEALSELVAGIGYEELGVDRRFRVAHHLMRAAETEGLLYVSKPGYRNHLDHVIDVWITGELLLGANGGNYFSFGIDTSTEIEKEKDRLRQWFIAALYHDMGYVIDVYPELHRHTRNFGSEHLDKLVKAVDEAMRKALSELNAEAKSNGPLRYELKDLRDHGIVSYSHLRQLLREVDESNRMVANQRDSVINLEKRYNNALRAVLLHNLSKEPIDAQADPLAALLVICDEIQEWGRFRLPVGEAAREIYDLINLQAVAQRERWGYTESVIIKNGRIEEGKLVGLKADEPIWLVIKYLDQNVNVYNPLNVLLFKLANLQRIGNGRFLNIRIDLQFPCLPRYDGRGDKVGEISILRRYVKLEDRGCMDPEVVTPAPENANQRVVYMPNRPEGYETFRINMNRLAGDDRPLIYKMPWDFQEDLLRFKREYCLRNGIKCTFLAEDDRTARYRDQTRT